MSQLTQDLAMDRSGIIIDIIEPQRLYVLGELSWLMLQQAAGEVKLVNAV